MAIAAHCHQVDCAFFLMEWHCGLVSAPGSMQFAAHCLQVDCGIFGKARRTPLPWPMPTVHWGKITAG